MSTKQQLTVWFFLGLLLVIYGVIIFLAGFFGNLAQFSQLSLRASEIWGVLQIIAGTFFIGVGRHR
jgi:hypothetical protein